MKHENPMVPYENYWNYGNLSSLRLSPLLTLQPFTSGKHVSTEENVDFCTISSKRTSSRCLNTFLQCFYNVPC